MTDSKGSIYIHITMNTLIAIRLDEALDKELDKKATAFGVSKSRLVRDALVDYLPKAKAPVKAEKPVAKKVAAPKTLKKTTVKPVAKKAIPSKKK